MWKEKRKARAAEKMIQKLEQDGFGSLRAGFSRQVSF